MTVVRLRRVVVAMAVAAVAASPGAAGADGARPVQEGVKVLAVSGIEGWVSPPGQGYPVTVTVTTDRLLEATVRLDVGGFEATTVVEREIELAGGNTATFRLLVPPLTADPFMPPGGQETIGEVAVRLVVDGATVARTKVEGRFETGQELVGVLPDARSAELPEVLPLLVDVGTARPVEVDSELLELGAAGFGPLDQVVTSPAELADLPEAHREALLGWVEAGGQLLLAGDPDELPGAALPEGWLPAPGGGVRAGLGRVRSVSETWQDELVPSPTRSGSEENTAALASSLPIANGSIGGRLSQDAGAVLPPGGRLGVMLALYVVVVGPVAFFVLRRFGRRRGPDGAGGTDGEDDAPLAVARPVRRPMAAWAAIPVVAVASTGVVVSAGGDLRRHAASAHVTVYEVGRAGATATTWSLLSNPGRQGAVGVGLPAGWTAGSASEALWFQESSSTVRVRATDDGVEASTRPPAGGFGMIRSAGPVAGMAGALEVTAESADDDVIRGTVRNRLDVALEDVVVLVGRSVMDGVGTLAPGEEKAFVVERASLSAFGDLPERGVWPDPADGLPGVIVVGDGRAVDVVEMQVDPAPAVPRGLKPLGAEQPAPPPTIAPDELIVSEDDTLIIRGGPGQPVPLPEPLPPDRRIGGESDEGPTMLAAWMQLLQERGGNFRPSGEVVAVGWTEELDPPVSPSDSGRVLRSRSAVVARATAEPSGDRLSDAAVVRSVVRGQGDVGQEVFFGITSAVVAFDLPPAVGDRPVDESRLMLHVLGEYTSVDVWTPQGWVSLADVPEDRDAEVPLPAGAVIGGQVFVRWSHPERTFPPQRDFVLYEKET